ncbi:hypothetical protein AAHE18_19G172800 [Arachis hypogaea]
MNRTRSTHAMGMANYLLLHTSVPNWLHQKYMVTKLRSSPNAVLPFITSAIQLESCWNVANDFFLLLECIGLYIPAYLIPAMVNCCSMTCICFRNWESIKILSDFILVIVLLSQVFEFVKS